MQKTFFPHLDGLRFFAFFLVFWQHGFAGLFPLLNLSAEYDRFFYTGELGVSFFFVLSGFLITYLLLKEVENNDKINLKAFYIRRILRIFPLYYLVVFFGFAIYPMLRQMAHLPVLDNGNPILYLFFLSNFDTIWATTDRSNFIGILWSVAIEEQFYVFWALLLSFLPTNFYKYLILSVILGSCLFRAANFDAKVLYFHTFSVMSDLGIGGGMAYLAINTSRFSGFFAEMKKGAIIFVYIFGVAVIWIYPQLFWLNQSKALQRLVFALFFAFIIAEQNYAENSFYKMGNHKTLSRLGIYTYALYLLHPVVIYFVQQLFPRFTGISSDNLTGVMLYGILAFVLSIAVSMVSYYYFESPFLRLKKRFAV